MIAIEYVEKDMSRMEIVNDSDVGVMLLLP